MTKKSATSKTWTQTLDQDLQNHVTVNETGEFGIPADKGNRGQFFYIPFLFISNQFISKQSWHVKLLMLTQARRNRGAGIELIEITNFYVNFQEKCFN